jgi:hypothetical protein
MDRTFGNSAGPKEVLMTNVCTANAGMAHLLNIRLYGMRRSYRTLEDWP